MYRVSSSSELEIIPEILAICEYGGTSKSAIIDSSELDRSKLDRYLTVLCNHQLLEETSTGSYHITAKGRSFLEDYRGMVTFLAQIEEHPLVGSTVYTEENGRDNSEELNGHDGLRQRLLRIYHEVLR